MKNILQKIIKEEVSSFFRKSKELVTEEGEYYNRERQYGSSYDQDPYEDRIREEQGEYSHHEDMINIWRDVMSGVPADSYRAYNLEEIGDAAVYMYSQDIMSLQKVDEYLARFIEMICSEFSEGEDGDAMMNDLNQLMNRLHDLNLPKSEQAFSKESLSDYALVLYGRT